MNSFDSPDNFRRYVFSALHKKALRGLRFKEIRDFVLKGLSEGVDWLDEFQWLLVMPRFLNIACAAGRCNCDCRMCTNLRDSELRWLRVEELRSILDNASTAEAVTFSSGNSDPLLNPDFVLLLEELSGRGMKCDFYTNALALDKKTADSLIASKSVSMINFSLDAATATTYERIRRRRFEIVQDNIRYFARRCSEDRVNSPILSFSMVAMRDNIAELPQLVEFAANNAGKRVVVQALLGRKNTDNIPAEDDDSWKIPVQKALVLATHYGIRLELPAIFHLRESPLPEKDNPLQKNSACSAKPSLQPIYACCSWIDGIWLELDGSIRPCCMNAVLDMGNIFDTRLWENEKFMQHKMLLLRGNVFSSCLSFTGQCPYLQDILRLGKSPVDYVG